MSVELGVLTETGENEDEDSNEDTQVEFGNNGVRGSRELEELEEHEEDLGELKLLDEDVLREKQSVAQRNYTYMVTCFACFASILEGFDMGVMSGALVFMERDFGLNKLQMGGLVSSFTFCMVIGAVAAGRTATEYGRRMTLFSAAVLFLIGATIMTVAGNFGVLLFGRMILGLAAGIAMLVAPLYAAELAPATNRGSLLSFVEVSINIGIFAGFIAAYAFKGFGNDTAWRCMISFGVVFSVILFVLICFLPESPRWLMSKQRTAEAETVLSRFLPPNEMQRSIEEIQASIELEQNRMKTNWVTVIFPWFELDAAQSSLRYMLYIGFLLAFFQMATGISGVQYYAPIIIDEAHGGDATDNQIFGGLIIFGAVKFFSIFVATFTLDHFGRRKLLMASSIGLFLALSGLAISRSVKHAPNWTGLFWICVYVSFFSIGWGPVFHVMMPEIFPLTVRSEAMSICLVVHRGTSGIIGLSFLTLQKVLSVAGTWWLLASLALLSFVCVYKFVPETKGMTLEQITASIALRSASRLQ